SEDLDLSLDDFITRINAELVNKHANLFSRAAQFLNRNLEGRLSALPFAQAEAQEEGESDQELLNLAREVVRRGRAIEKHYRNREFAMALRELGAIADVGNEYMQGQKPWEQVKTDPEAARLTLSFALNVCHAIAMYLQPIVPRFAQAGARILGIELGTIDAGNLFGLREQPIGEMERLFDRIDRKAVDKIVEASKDNLASKDEDKKSEKAESKSKKKKKETPPGVIGIDDFAKVELKVGLVQSVEAVPKSDKLLKLMVELGEASPRQIVSGIAEHYAPEDLVGKRVVVVSNLAPAKLRGVESQGMILAAESGDSLEVVTLGEGLPPGATVR
ncbi:MAG: methionine--tRNA ligase subunit beta, partial [Myxococcota bacterium]